MDSDTLVLMGRITGAHGVRGNVRIHSYAQSPDVYQAGKSVVVASPDGVTRRMTVAWVRPHGRGLLMGLDTVSDREQAERLAGSTLYMDKARLPDLEEDSYYWFDLIGLSVYDTAGILLGRLQEVIATPGNDVYVVKANSEAGPREWLLPAIGAVVLAVDLEKKTMIVKPPEGL